MNQNSCSHEGINNKVQSSTFTNSKIEALHAGF